MKKKVEKHTNYFALIFIILLISISTFFGLRHFSKHVYIINENDACTIAMRVQTIIREKQPHSTIYADFGDENDYFLKKYISEVSYQYEGIRAFSGLFDQENDTVQAMTTEEKKEAFKNHLNFDMQDSSVIVLFCSETEFNFCLDFAKSIDKEKTLILVKSKKTTFLSYDNSGNSRCLIR